MSSLSHMRVASLQPSIPTSCSVSTIPWFPLNDPPPVASYSLLLLTLSRFSEAASLPPLDATMRPSCDLHPRIPSLLRTLQLLVTILPTVLRLPAVSLCRSSLTAFLPLPALFPPRVSPMSRMETVAPASP